MRTKLRISVISFFLFSLIGIGLLSAEDNTGLDFESAAADYRQAKYDEAIAKYQKILSSGSESGNLYYNLGNCHIKKGDLAKAMLNYERARQLMPRDKDLQANYQYAKSLLKLKVEPKPKIWILRILDSFYGNFTVDGLTLFCFLFYLILVILIAVAAAFVLWRAKLFGIIIILAILFLTSLFAVVERVNLSQHQAIILVSETAAKFEPFSEATTYFNLYAGMEVEIISSNDGWVKVRRQDGKSGWINRDNLEKVQ